MPFPMTLTTMTEPTHTDDLTAELARVRSEQLDHAQAGRIIDSARSAARARTIRAAMDAERTTPSLTRNTVLAALSGLALVPAVAAAQPTPVRTAQVAQETVQEHRRVTGSLQAVSRASVAAQEPGLVESVVVDEGAAVRGGDVVLKLDDRRLRAQLEEARAEHANYGAIVAQRKAELAFAQLDLERMREAHAEGAAGVREIAELETMLGVRESQLEAAQRVVESTARRIDLLEIRLEDTVVRAPFDARVVERHVEPGEWTEPGTPLLTLVSTGTIEARLEVPERYAQAVFASPESLFVQLGSDGRSIPSVEVRPVPDVDERARTFQIFVTLDNPTGELAPGMAVNAWVPTAAESVALLAPKDAVIRDGRDAFVYIVGAGEQPEAEQTPVTVLFAWGDMLALSSNTIEAGDTVVIEGNERLMPNAPLAIASIGSNRRR
ncbi:MAG: efflux RND transporter periplasmic adaptor subunit [Planctomycetota bacterium]